jgi:outer membrane murein-binding lipoprotein Lpp
MELLSFDQVKALETDMAAMRAAERAAHEGR